jgi:hypothetical protein
MRVKFRAVTNEHGIRVRSSPPFETTKDGAASSRNGPGRQQNQRWASPKFVKKLCPLLAETEFLSDHKFGWTIATANDCNKKAGDTVIM